MPIYDIFDYLPEQDELEKGRSASVDSFPSLLSEQRYSGKEEKKDLFATIIARLFFFILFVVDVIWGIYTIGLFIISLSLNLLTGFKVYQLKRFFLRRYLNLKRVAIGGIALIVALFSPALGIMIACSYFLMYDKQGVQEIVPTFLQDQFEEFFHPLYSKGR